MSILQAKDGRSAHLSQASNTDIPADAKIRRFPERGSGRSASRHHLRQAEYVSSAFSPASWFPLYIAGRVNILARFWRCPILTQPIIEGTFVPCRMLVRRDVIR